MAQPQEAWLTVTGDINNKALNTIQVDAKSIDVEASVRTLKVRVNRSSIRQNWEKKPYRSFVSIVQFDCAAQAAATRSIDYYTVPLWQGKSFSVSYPPDKMPALTFRGVVPNPAAQLIRAACVL